MDRETHFRALLIKLQDSLSEMDRSRLHFLFGSVIPRRIRDDPSINGTLNLLESLFDCGKVNAQDFYYLIQAFKEIDRHDIAQRLQIHAREIGKTMPTNGLTLIKQMNQDTEDEPQLCIVQDTCEVETDGTSSLLIKPKLPANKIELNSVGNRSSHLGGKQKLAIWNHWKKVVIALILIVIVAAVLLLTWLFIRTRPEPSGNRHKVIVASTSYPDRSKSKNNINNYLRTLNTTPVIVAHFTAWSIYARQYFVYNIPAAKITHINYAFAAINSNGEIELGDGNADTAKSMLDDTPEQPLRGNFNRLIELKKLYPDLRTLISVGGSEGSKFFSDVAFNAQNRSKFAASCVTFIKEYEFDGIDISWLYPVSGGLSSNIRRPEDKQNYVLLLKELREQLDASGNKRYLLTIQGGVGDHIHNLDLPSIINYLDWINVLTYNFHGSWEAETNHHAPLYGTVGRKESELHSRLNCDAAIQAYIAGGVPSTKLVMSIPLYGRGWQGVRANSQNGYLQKASSAILNGTWDRDACFDYDHLKKDFIPSYEQHFDKIAKAPYLFNASTGIWISYDNVQSIGWKTKYIRDRRLRGASFWELSMDRQSDLINSTHEALINGKDILKYD